MISGCMGGETETLIDLLLINLYTGTVHQNVIVCAWHESCSGIFHTSWCHDTKSSILQEMLVFADPITNNNLSDLWKLKGSLFLCCFRQPSKNCAEKGSDWQRRALIGGEEAPTRGSYWWRRALTGKEEGLQLAVKGSDWRRRGSDWLRLAVKGSDRWRRGSNWRWRAPTSRLAEKTPIDREGL